MSVLYILIIAALVLFFVGKWKKSPKQRGAEGEREVHGILSKLPEGYYLLDNVVLMKGTRTTQIEHIVVSKYGVFAIETKNYRGDIYGDDNRQHWTQIIRTDVRYRRKWYKTYTYITKNNFYNPVKQSLGHVSGIKKSLAGCPSVPVIPIVVFAGEANLRGVQTGSHVIYDTELLSTISQYRKIYLSDSEVQKVFECLYRKNVSGLVDEITHVHNVNAAKSNYQRIIDSGRCPRCGGLLVLRNGKYGSFYGCSNYPNCTFKYTSH